MLTWRHGLKNVVKVHLRQQHAIQLCRRHFGTSQEPTDVAILGGGITGLASAYYLSRTHPSINITIYEASPRIGGWLSSERIDIDDGSILFEKGPRTLRPAGNGVLAGRLIQDLGLVDETIFTLKSAPAAKNRFIYYPDHLVRVPQPDPSATLWANASMMADTVATEEAFQGSLFAGVREYFRPPRAASMSDESIGDFFSRRFSKDLVDRVLSAVVHGIYAGDVYQLSVKSLFAGLWKLEAKHGSLVSGFLSSVGNGPLVPMREARFTEIMSHPPYPWLPDFKKKFRRSSVFTFRNGLQQLIDRLAEELRKRHNVKIVTNAAVKEVLPGEDSVKLSLEGSSDAPTHSHAISTLSPKHLQQFLTQLKPDHLGSSWSNFTIAPAPTVMTVNMYYRTPNLHPPGFGYLIPLATSSEQNPERALGVVFDTSYSAGREGDADILGPVQDTVSKRGTKLTVMLGGHYWDGWTAFPTEEEGLEMAKSLLKRHLNITELPAAYAVNIQRDCIPQYTVGYEGRLKRVHDALLNQYSGRLRVAGNWIRGVGVNDCLRSAWEVTRELTDADKTGLEAAVEEKEWATLVPRARRK